MWLIACAIAFLLPDRLEPGSVLKYFVELIGYIVPAITKTQQVGSIPDIASGYFAVMWILVLVWIPLYFLLADEEVRTYSAFTKIRWAFYVFPVFFILVTWLMWALPVSGHGRIAQIMLSSRSGLFLVGGTIFCVLPLYLRVMRAWIRYLPRVLNNEGMED